MGGLSPRVDPAVAEKARLDGLVKLAQAHLAAKRWGDAVQTALQARSAAGDGASAGTIEQMLRQLDAEGQRQLEAARQLYSQKRYVEALDAFGLVHRTFSPLPPGLEALAAQKQAEEDPEVQAAVQEHHAAKLNEQAERMLGFGERAVAAASRSQPAPRTRHERIRRLRPADQVRVLDVLEQVAALYPQSPTGQAVAAELKILAGDEAWARQIEKTRLEIKANSALGQGRAFEAAGRLDRALACYEEVVKDFPETQAGKDAQTKVDELRKAIASGS